MESELEHLAEDRVVVIDNSFLFIGKDNLCSMLYESRWAEIDPVNIEAEIEHVNIIEELINNQDVRIISETLREIEEAVRQLNGHMNYINNPGVKYKGKYKAAAEKQKKRREWKEEIEEGETYSTYTTYVHKLFELFSKIKRCPDPRNEFSRKDGEIYNYFLERARLRSRDIHYNQKEREHLKNALNIGAELETDRKIAATVISLVYSNNVLVLTRDKDIPLLIDRLYAESYGARNIKNPPPKGKFIIFGTNPRDKYRPELVLQ